jgi:DNA-binding transcriptional ArsR family regulator
MAFGYYFDIIGNMKSIEAIKALSALAQDSRLAAFRLLVEAGPGGMAAGAIADRLGLPAPTASFHLAQLANAGLVRSRTEGRFVIYAADFDRMQTLIGFLTDNCCEGGVCAVSRVAPVTLALPQRTKSTP